MLKGMGSIWYVMGSQVEWIKWRKQPTKVSESACQPVSYHDWWNILKRAFKYIFGTCARGSYGMRWTYYVYGGVVNVCKVWMYAARIYFDDLRCGFWYGTHQKTTQILVKSSERICYRPVWNIWWEEKYFCASFCLWSRVAWLMSGEGTTVIYSTS